MENTKSLNLPLSLSLPTQMARPRVFVVGVFILQPEGERKTKAESEDKTVVVSNVGRKCWGKYRRTREKRFRTGYLY